MIPLAGGRRKGDADVRGFGSPSWVASACGRGFGGSTGRGKPIIGATRIERMQSRTRVYRWHFYDAGAVVSLCRARFYRSDERRADIVAPALQCDRCARLLAKRTRAPRMLAQSEGRAS